MKWKNKLVGKQVVTMSNSRKKQTLLKVIIIGREKRSQYNKRIFNRRNYDKGIIGLGMKTSKLLMAPDRD